MDELQLQNQLGTDSARRAIGSLSPDITSWMNWKKKYARFPLIIGGHFVWRRHYWRRDSSLKRYDYMYALKQPRLSGREYGLWETLHEDHVYERHIKNHKVTVKTRGL